jgi:hypothetical protein
VGGSLLALLVTAWDHSRQSSVRDLDIRMIVTLSFIDGTRPVEMYLEFDQWAACEKAGPVYCKVAQASIPDLKRATCRCVGSEAGAP